MAFSGSMLTLTINSLNVQFCFESKLGVLFFYVIIIFFFTSIFINYCFVSSGTLILILKMSD